MSAARTFAPACRSLAFSAWYECPPSRAARASTDLSVRGSPPRSGCRLTPVPHAPLQLLMYAILTSGGEWYLGVSEEDAASASSACLVAAVIYGVYLVWCGMKLTSASASPKGKQSEDDV